VSPGEEIAYPLAQAAATGEGTSSRVDVSNGSTTWTFAYPQLANASADQTVELVFGLAAETEGRLTVSWEDSGSSVQVRSLDGGFRSLLASDFDEGTVVTSRRGPTLIDATHTWGLDGRWAAAAQALMTEDEARYELCLTRGGTEHCDRETSWDGEPVACPLSPLSKGNEIGLEMESQEGSVFILEALPLVDGIPTGPSGIDCHT
jgi:hypothetical protein